MKNLREDECFLLLMNKIKEVAHGKKIIYVPNNGNWGDALINKGAQQFFDFYGINYSNLQRSKVEQLLTGLDHA